MPKKQYIVMLTAEERSYLRGLDEPARGKGYLWEAFFSAWDSYLEDDSDDVSKPNAHIMSVSKRDMDGMMSRFERHVSPCKQKNVTVSRFDPPNTAATSTEDDIEAFDECAGIMEHKGGMTREEAESSGSRDARPRSRVRSRAANPRDRDLQ